MKRFFKILLLVVVIFVIFCAYIFFVPHGGARRELAKYKKQLIAQGEKLDLVSLGAAHKPDAINRAKEFLAISGMWRITNSWDFDPAMKMVDSGRAAVGHTNIDAKWMATYETNKIFAARLRGIFPGARLDFGLDYSKGAALLLPHLVQFKLLSQQLSITAMQALHENDLEEANHNLIAGADLMRLWDDEPFLISALVRNACLRISISAAWEGLQHGGWTDAQLAALQSAWERIDLINSMATALYGERALGSDVMTQARKVKSVDDLSAFGSSGGTGPANLADWINRFLVSPKAVLHDTYERYPRFWSWKSKWSFEEELCGLQLATAAVNASRHMQTNGIFVPVFNELAIQSSNILKLHARARDRFMLLNEQSGFLYDSSTLDVDQNAMRKIAGVETARRLLITAIALKRYHLRHAAWPDKLEQLVPDFLAQVPIDFMDGKPLRYRLLPTGLLEYPFRLYSVGVDGKDDGGVGVMPSSGSNAPPPIIMPGRLPSIDWTATRDIVWPQPTRFEEYRLYIANLIRSATNAPNKTLPPPAK